MRIGENTSIWLDFLRGTSAQLVVLGHCLMVLLSLQSISASARDLLSYGSVIASHAVVAFFVLSGFLVGGKVVRQIQASTFRPLMFVRDRAVRLTLVAIPAILLTGVVDSLTFGWGGGWSLLQTPIFSGTFLESNPWSLSTLGANFLYLQTILAPTYGTNAALWSLSNEFWYYLAFPCLCGVLVFRGNKAFVSLAGLAAIASLLMLAEPQRRMTYLFYFAIWLTGVLVSLIHESARRPLAVACIVTAIFTVITQGFSLSRIGLSVSTLLVSSVVLFSPDIPAIRLRAIANALARHSYSLYATHYPFLLLFVSADHIRERQFEVFDLWHASIYWLIVNVLGLMFWYAVERHNDAVRKLFSVKRFAVILDSFRNRFGKR